MWCTCDLTAPWGIPGNLSKSVVSGSCVHTWRRRKPNCKVWIESFIDKRNCQIMQRNLVSHFQKMSQGCHVSCVHVMITSWHCGVCLEGFLMRSRLSLKLIGLPGKCSSIPCRILLYTAPMHGYTTQNFQDEAKSDRSFLTIASKRIGLIS